MKAADVVLAHEPGERVERVGVAAEICGFERGNDQPAGHAVAGRTIVKDDAELVRGTIERQLANPEIEAIITTGGTGITSRDSTYEAVSGLLQKKLDGFGELFRGLSYQQIGSAAMMS